MCHLLCSLRPVPRPGAGHGACRGPVEDGPVGVLQDAAAVWLIATRRASVRMQDSLMLLQQILLRCTRGMLRPFGSMPVIKDDLLRSKTQPFMQKGCLQSLSTFITDAAAIRCYGLWPYDTPFQNSTCRPHVLRNCASELCLLGQVVRNSVQLELIMIPGSSS